MNYENQLKKQLKAQDESIAKLNEENKAVKRQLEATQAALDELMTGGTS